MFYKPFQNLLTLFQILQIFTKGSEADELILGYFLFLVVVR